MKKNRITIRIVSMILCAVLFAGEFGNVATYAAEPEVIATEPGTTEPGENQPSNKQPGENQPATTTPTQIAGETPESALATEVNPTGQIGEASEPIPANANETNEENPNEDTKSAPVSDADSIEYAFDTFNEKTVLPSDVVSNTVIEQNGSIGNCVSEIEMNGNVATVSFGINQEATVIVSVFDNDNKQMLASGWSDVTAEMNTVNVTISNGEMPTYYYLRSYIVERESLTPLSTVYVSNYYTQSIQEFLAKTPEDFEKAGESVLMLEDEGATEDSFAVLADDVVVIYCDPDEIITEDNSASGKIADADETSEESKDDNSASGKIADADETSDESGDVSDYKPILGYAQNELIAYDESIYTFTFANPDLNLTMIARNGRGKFVYKYKGTEMMVIDAWRAGFTDEGYVLLSAKDSTEIEDFFKNVKIDEKDKEVSNADGSDADSGVELFSESTDGGLSFKFKISSLFKEKEDKKPEMEKIVKTEGEIKPDIILGLSATFTCKTVYTKDEKYSLSKVTITFSVDGTIEASGKVTIRLCRAIFKYAAFTAEIPIYLVLGGNLTLGLNYSISYEIGTEFHKYGNTPIRNELESKLEAQFDGTIEVGILAEVELSILCKAFANVKLSTYLGARLTLSAVGSLNEEVIHDCDGLCLEGYVAPVGFIEVSGKIIGIFEGKITLMNKTFESVPIYVCLNPKHSNHIFAFTVCPDKQYRTIISIYDKKRQPIAGTTVAIYNGRTGTEKSYKTNKAGQAVEYLKSGRYTIKFTDFNGNPAEQDFRVSDAARSITIYDDIYVNNIKKMVTGDTFSAYLTSDGRVYTIGNNSHGQLGNNTTDSSSIPIEVKGLGTVKFIAAGGSAMAAINTNGELYMWGSNVYGQMADGTRQDVLSPRKVILGDKVKQVAVSDFTAGAITQRGLLYMWGANDFGQIGSGTTGGYCLTPENINIDGNEKAVLLALGKYTSGVVTKTNKLYTWGVNEYYQLGIGNTTDKNVPTYVTTDNIVSLAFGSHVSGYVNSSGNFYVWGYKKSVGSYGCNCYYGSSLLYSADCSISKLSKPCLNKYYTNAKAVYMDDCLTGLVSNDGKFIYGGFYQNTIIENHGSYYTRSTGDFVEDMALSANGRFFLITDVNIVRRSSKWEEYTFNEGDKSTDADNTALDYSEACDFSDEALLGETVNSTVSGNEVTLSLTDLEADTIYNIYATTIPEKENVLSATDSLLCIDQLASDENGCINATMYMQKEYEEPCIFAVAMTKKDISTATITVDDANSDGSYIICNPVVTYGDRTLTEGVDYELYSGFAGMNAGTYTLVIRGIGEFDGFCQTEWKINTLATNVSVMFTSLSLSGSIITNTYVKVPESILEDSGAYVMAAGEKTLINNLAQTSVGDETMYVVRYKCSAKDYDTPKSISFFTGEDLQLGAENSAGEPFEGGTYISSVKDYIEIALKDANETTQRNIIEGLENYCVFAKAYLTDGSVGVAPLETYKQSMKNIKANDFSGDEKVKTGSVDGLEYLGSSMLLESDTVIRHYFKLKTGFDIEDYTFKVNDRMLAPMEKNGVFYVDICSVPAGHYADKFSLEVKDSNNKTFTLSYSVNSYIYSALSKENVSEGLAELAKAMHLYDSCI